MTRDPVCETDVEEPDAIEHGRFYFYAEQMYYFCSSECLARFREHPQRYAHVVPEREPSPMTDDYVG